MTDLQVRYQLAQETERANRAREAIQSYEADIKSREADTKQFMADLEKQKVPYEVAKLIADADVAKAQRDKIGQETVNLMKELDLIQARTDLTTAQKEAEMEKVAEARFYRFKRESGMSWFDGLVNGILGLFKGAGTKALFA